MAGLGQAVTGGKILLRKGRFIRRIHRSTLRGRRSPRASMRRRVSIILAGGTARIDGWTSMIMTNGWSWRRGNSCIASGSMLMPDFNGCVGCAVADGRCWLMGLMGLEAGLRMGWLLMLLDGCGACPINVGWLVGYGACPIDVGWLVGCSGCPIDVGLLVGMVEDLSAGTVLLGQRKPSAATCAAKLIDIWPR